MKDTISDNLMHVIIAAFIALCVFAGVVGYAVYAIEKPGCVEATK